MQAAQAAGAANRPAISYGGDFTLNADILDATITAINLANHNPGILTVSQNLSIGSIVPDAHGVGVDGRLPIKIEAGHTLTLTGTPAAVANHGFDAVANDYTGLGNVELGGAGSTLVVHSGGGDIAVGSVSAGVNQQGVLTFTTGGTVGQIGATARRLATVNIGYAGGAATVTLNGNVHANNTNLAHANSVLNVGEGKTIFGNITTDAADTGTLTFLRAGIVTGKIGATNALAEVNFGIAAGQPNEGGGAVELRGAATATQFNIKHANANVTARGLMNGKVNFNAAG
ncbi:MAG: hypothetical protein PV347_03750 [Rickettsiaceae bacterium]|nr:hypothetical protein [Rickettsiaceae bacterium]MDD9337839.1 hypothetical protein [Rickettsiaceae bacterium]